MTDDEFESVVLHFEQVRKPGGSCVIADFLDRFPDSTGAERSRLLIELICIDLEFGWRHSNESQPRLENYVERFPELGSLDRLPIELVGEEYRVRRRWGDRPTHQGFIERFRDRIEQIVAELRRIDAELEFEGTPVLWSSDARNLPEPDREIRWLSSDDFLLRRLIGAGGMGKVYEADHKKDQRRVAVKFLRKSLVSHADFVRRFVEEAKTIARLRHPNIVGTEGLGRTIGGSYFIVMDHVGGSDLSRIAARRPIEVGEAVRWMIETCNALQYAHKLGVVHCDLKPANLLLDEHQKIRVTDFGLARSIDGENPRRVEIAGTLPFMAPEQASDQWGPIDHRTDVYGVGALLFTLLIGRPPWIGPTRPEILAKILSAKPVIRVNEPRPDLPSNLVDLCAKCLAKDPSARFATIQDVRSALESFLVDVS